MLFWYRACCDELELVEGLQRRVGLCGHVLLERISGMGRCIVLQCVVHCLQR